MGKWEPVNGKKVTMRNGQFRNWGFVEKDIFLAAGPCSAESESQVLRVAHALAGSDVGFLRAGIWKPRTRPGSFEGVGRKGLAWLARARSETGLRVGTEVAEPSHVEACLAYDLDILWIGARTTTNPFSVQAIADALRGVDIPVLIKNPMNEDIGLWIGALERLSNAGITKLGAIHRGVGSSLEMRYRNAPVWRLPIELMRRMPELPILCDPSHICGKADLIAMVAQEAMDLLFDGLMVEVHPDPAHALSDAAQQLKPDQFFEMISGLKHPHERGGSSGFVRRLNTLREQVDQLDSHLLEMLGRRMEIVREMGTLKAEQNISTLQPHRWKEILEDRVKKGSSLGFGPDFVINLMQIIHEEAIRRQEADRLGDSD
ncbi:MAG TPA: chorismate mutase [Pontiella sp.]|nr:chorismate mutase [Pontiella sp.]